MVVDHNIHEQLYIVGNSIYPIEPLVHLENFC